MNYCFSIITKLLNIKKYKRTHNNTKNTHFKTFLCTQRLAAILKTRCRWLSRNNHLLGNKSACRIFYIHLCNYTKEQYTHLAPSLYGNNDQCLDLSPLDSILQLLKILDLQRPTKWAEVSYKESWNLIPKPNLNPNLSPNPIGCLVLILA